MQFRDILFLSMRHMWDKNVDVAFQALTWHTKRTITRESWDNAWDTAFLVILLYFWMIRWNLRTSWNNLILTEPLETWKKTWEERKASSYLLSFCWKHVLSRLTSKWIQTKRADIMYLFWVTIPTIIHLSLLSLSPTHHEAVKMLLYWLYFTYDLRNIRCHFLALKSCCDFLPCFSWDINSWNSWNKKQEQEPENSCLKASISRIM